MRPKLKSKNSKRPTLVVTPIVQTDQRVSLPALSIPTKHDSVPSQEALRQSILDYSGLKKEDLQNAAKCLVDGLKAMDTKFFQFQGSVMSKRDVIAWKTRLESASKLLQLFDVRVTPEKPSSKMKAKARVIDASWLSTSGDTKQAKGIEVELSNE